MKKIIFILLAISFVFIIGTCNTPVDPNNPGGGDGNAVELFFNVDYVFDLETEGSYPGAEFDLAKALIDYEINGVFVDISKYQAIELDVELYTSYEGTPTNGTGILAELPASGGDLNLAQFRILKNISGWNVSDNFCHPDAFYELPVSGNKTFVIPSNASGIPGALLLQANWAAHGTNEKQKVTHIKVNTIKFLLPGDSVILTVVYNKDQGNFVDLQDNNKIVFTNARNDSGAVSYNLKDYLDNIENKTVTVSYTIENPNESNTVEYQLVIQAAGDGENAVNTDGNAQWYPVLNKAGGTFSLEGNLLDQRIKAKGFTLSNFRIANNGGTRQDDNPVNPQRELSYVLIINSVTVN